MNHSFRVFSLYLHSSKYKTQNYAITYMVFLKYIPKNIKKPSLSSSW